MSGTPEEGRSSGHILTFCRWDLATLEFGKPKLTVHARSTQLQAKMHKVSRRLRPSIYNRVSARGAAC
jgi:hypothetical protein